MDFLSKFSHIPFRHDLVKLECVMRILRVTFHDPDNVLTGKPYRLTNVEMAYPNYRMNMFRQACTWTSFTINRNDVKWNYKTFLRETLFT